MPPANAFFLRHEEEERGQLKPYKSLFITISYLPIKYVMFTCYEYLPIKYVMFTCYDWLVSISTINLLDLINSINNVY